ncbi:MAG TPA: 4Fe-4S dicluster domain-containing protein [Methylomirabilota bacterium]|nr:4Fe-4S dicluster domain-containing protein [Methylomirabilota bacterium]
MRYGFVIDQRKCIGCHACTVACKEENQVPLGAFRTWVKYVERGRYPDTRRYFSVLRCNHCDDAPCVTICPTVALYRRSDGIVDFDGERCIGCKSCMQACPYDALYIDPGTNTAAKCNYCAHRVEVGLEPACVIVCPEQAIIAGDLDDPGTQIARLVATEQVQVRKAEQGTRPKVFYLGADAAALTPSMQSQSEQYIFATRPAAEVDLVRMVTAVQQMEHGDGLSRPVYDAPHMTRPWSWKVSAYLWTKSIAAGVLMIAGLVSLLGASPSSFVLGAAPPLVALLFLALTTGLLVFDLKRPDRFHYILFKGNRRSWLVWGAWILMAYGCVAVAWLVGAHAGAAGLLRVLAVPTMVLAAGAAGYSAFLFGQAEGRDLWQSPLLLPQLLVAALAAGAAALLVIAVVAGSDAPSLRALVATLIVALVLEAGLFFAEFSGAHANVDVARAARLITRGALSGRFWGGAVAAGIAVPLVLTLFGTPAVLLGAILALAGLWIYEDVWVKAGQSIPLS